MFEITYLNIINFNTAGQQKVITIIIIMNIIDIGDKIREVYHKCFGKKKII